MNLPPDAVGLPTAIVATTSVATVGVLISSVEDLVGLGLFRTGGLLNWDVMRVQEAWSARAWSGKLSTILFNYTGFKIALTMRLVAAPVLLLFQRNHPIFLVSCLIILLSLVALSFRGVYGLDGAHQMYVVIFGALFLGGIAGEDSVGSIFSVWFVALQAGLSYFIAGVNKLLSPVWRSGGALTGVFGTRTYGHPVAYSMIRTRPTLARILSWTVILFESGFCLVFALDLRLALCILLAGAAFHVSTAVLMGLNGFLFAFIATYPCIAYCVTVLSS